MADNTTQLQRSTHTACRSKSRWKQKQFFLMKKELLQVTYKIVSQIFISFLLFVVDKQRPSSRLNGHSVTWNLRLLGEQSSSVDEDKFEHNNMKMWDFEVDVNNNDTDSKTFVNKNTCKSFNHNKENDKFDSNMSRHDEKEVHSSTITLNNNTKIEKSEQSLESSKQINSNTTQQICQELKNRNEVLNFIENSKKTYSDFNKNAPHLEEIDKINDDIKLQNGNYKKEVKGKGDYKSSAEVFATEKGNKNHVKRLSLDVTRKVMQ